MVNYHKTEKGNLRLYVPTKYGVQFENLVREYVVETMKRKLY